MNNKNTPSKLSENYVKKLLKKGVDEGVFPGAAAGIFFRKNEIKNKLISCYGNASLVPREQEN